MNQQNHLVLVNGTRHMFAYRNLVTSWVSRKGGRMWCKQLSGWEISLKNFYQPPFDGVWVTPVSDIQGQLFTVE